MLEYDNLIWRNGDGTLRCCPPLISMVSNIQVRPAASITERVSGARETIICRARRCAMLAPCLRGIHFSRQFRILWLTHQ